MGLHFRNLEKLELVEVSTHQNPFVVFHQLVSRPINQRSLWKCANYVLTPSKLERAPDIVIVGIFGNEEMGLCYRLKQREAPASHDDILFLGDWTGK
jgi:hypothetical protein